MCIQMDVDCVSHIVPHITVVLDYSECLTIDRCLNLL